MDYLASGYIPLCNDIVAEGISLKLKRYIKFIDEKILLKFCYLLSMKAI